MEAPIEGGQGPEGAVVPYTEGWNSRTDFVVSIYVDMSIEN